MNTNTIRNTILTHDWDYETLMTELKATKQQERETVVEVLTQLQQENKLYIYLKVGDRLQIELNTEAP